jgi:reverse gyrase
MQQQSNIEEMTMKELREECKKRNLGSSGTKQKLIERLKTTSTTTLQIVKSPGKQRI